VGSRLTPEVLAKQMERLEANWGPPKDRTAGQMVAMTREWFSQLERFGSKTVTDAFTHVIGTHEFQWGGVFPKILGYCTRDDSEWREIVTMHDQRARLALPPPEEKFVPDNRTPEEREALIAEMKKNAGLKSQAEVIAEENSRRAPREIPPAPAVSDASEALLNTKLVRGLREKQQTERTGPANGLQSSPTGSGKLFDA
jgi:hypothetical protein